MAGTAIKRTKEGSSLGTTEAVRNEHNKVVTDLETLRSNPDLIARNRCMAAGGCARGTTAQKAKTVNTVTFSINGQLVTKAATDDLWTLSGTNVATAKAQKYLLCLDASGTASIVEGTQAASAGAVTLPSLPASKSVIGVLTVVNASGANFVPGTTALNAAGITATFIDGLDSGYFSAGASAMTAAQVLDRKGNA